MSNRVSERQKKDEDGKDCIIVEPTLWRLKEDFQGLGMTPCPWNDLVWLPFLFLWLFLSFFLYKTEWYYHWVTSVFQGTVISTLFRDFFSLVDSVKCLWQSFHKYELFGHTLWCICLQFDCISLDGSLFIKWYGGIFFFWLTGYRVIRKNSINYMQLKSLMIKLFNCDKIR